MHGSKTKQEDGPCFGYRGRGVCGKNYHFLGQESEEIDIIDAKNQIPSLCYAFLYTDVMMMQ